MPKAAYKLNPFFTYPLGHQEHDMMPEYPAEGSKGNDGISAGSFDDGIARFDLTGWVSFLEDTKRHAVPDTSGNIEIFALGITVRSSP